LFIYKIIYFEIRFFCKLYNKRVYNTLSNTPTIFKLKIDATWFVPAFYIIYTCSISNSNAISMKRLRFIFICSINKKWCFPAKSLMRFAYIIIYKHLLVIRGAKLCLTLHYNYIIVIYYFRNNKQLLLFFIIYYLYYII